MLSEISIRKIYNASLHRKGNQNAVTNRIFQNKIFILADEYGKNIVELN